jgi:SAM-dependent methyltransferase
MIGKSTAVQINHWYDGWFYDKFIAPNQDKAFDKVAEIIGSNAAVLDAGCGTGRLCFRLGSSSSKIDGVDASAKNIYIAEQNLKKNLPNNIRFINKDIKTFLSEANYKYDYAVLSYVIHEIDKDKRNEILNLLSTYAHKIIIIDYLVPHPKSITGIINRLVEFLAGKNHNRNFKSFLKNKGIYGLSEEARLKIIKEIKNEPKTSHIVVLSTS